MLFCSRGRRFLQALGGGFFQALQWVDGLAIIKHTENLVYHRYAPEREGA